MSLYKIILKNMAKSKITNKWIRKRTELYTKVSDYVRRHKKDLGRNPHRLDGTPKNHPSKLVQMHCSADVEWLENSTSFGGHSRPSGGHRRVSGLVRASLKQELQRELVKAFDSESIPEEDLINYVRLTQTFAGKKNN